MGQFNPRTPEVLAWIANLRPEAEYVVRKAMLMVFEHCRNPEWRERVRELEKAVVRTEADRRHYEREIEGTVRLIAESQGPKAS